MNRILLIINLLMLSVSLQAMNVPQPKEISEEKITVLFGEQQDALEIPIQQARLIKGLQDLLNPQLCKEDNKTFPLPEVSLEIGKLIVPQLGRVYAYTHQNSNLALGAIADDFKKLDGNTLVRVLRAADYLDIPFLLTIAYEALRGRNPKTISISALASLSSRLRSPFIQDKVAALLGIEYVKGNSSAAIDSSDEDEDPSFSDKRLPVIHELVRWKGHESWISSVCVTADNKIVSGSVDETIRIWNMKGNQLGVCRGHEHFVTSVCMTTDNKIVSGSKDKTVRIWDMQGNQLAVYKGHEDHVVSVCVTTDNKIVSGSSDNTIRIWDLQGNQLGVCEGHKDDVTSVCMTFDNKIISASEDRTIRIWDLQGNQLAVCKGHKALVGTVCVTADNKIVSGSDDKTIRLWDMQGNQLALAKGHEGEIMSVCVTADNKIVSSSCDKTIRIWDMLGHQLAVSRGLGDGVTSVCVTGDNKIVSGSYDKMFRVWDLEKFLVLEGISKASFMSQQKTEEILSVLVAYDAGIKDAEVCFNALKNIVSM